MKIGFLFAALAILAGGFLECSKQVAALNASNRELKTALYAFNESVDKKNLETRKDLAEIDFKAQQAIAIGESNFSRLEDIKKALPTIEALAFDACATLEEIQRKNNQLEPQKTINLEDIVSEVLTMNDEIEKAKREKSAAWDAEVQRRINAKPQKSK